jgi:hypothetical protein
MLYCIQDVTLLRKKEAGILGNRISKKELLSRYNISYGTLYRWKRMGLIPDDWLVKKSTYTGQETFFDEQQICERVEAIIARKDTESLEDIAKELLNKAESETKLRIISRYGNKEYTLTDISDIVFVKNGKEISIIEGFKAIAKQINNQED